ncbi:ATP-binding protein [Nocardia sp. NBC_00565]|uniref:sensor histidine kinase n=1 Tax=Nocardia sp. NBC_00565 TaxID=2975993 RepID=UPI002E810357|nr:ATP-binding protein [Nocardia sp. NBC_00565]WUC04930.1 ATP-binding protein [Nocardia sp. NBC_00565]
MRGRTIRLRLTLLYAGAFFIAGAILVALMYFYLDQSLDRRYGVGAQRLVREYLTKRNRPIVSEELYAALTAQAAKERRDTLEAMLVWSLVSLGAIGIAAGGLGWLLAGRVLNPLQQITATARRVADRSLHERIDLTGPDDEIKDLADTFDAMLERLDRAFDGQRRFVANASHELRTPLTINRTLIEVALDDPDAPESTRRLGATLLEVNHRHERLIDGLLVLASSEPRLIERSRVDLAEIARRVVAVADQAGIEIRADLAAAPVSGDPVLLERLAQNLADNAIRYNVGESGWVAIRSASTAGSAQLIVENTGPVVPAFEVDGLFEPFRRLASGERVAESAHTPNSRGAGLGLSIVRSVANAHGGEVRATARPEGGLTVIVSIPNEKAGGTR